MNLSTFLFMVLLFACSSKSNRNSTTDKDSEMDTVAPELTETRDVSNQIVSDHLESAEWNTDQDSIRIQLVKSKPDNFLIGSLLEELYIRNLISISDSLLAINIRFDLHSFDCGAPDCYSTDVNLSFPHRGRLEFPEIINFTIHEHGCVDSEMKTSGSLKLIELGTNYVNYYSTDQKSNLVILGSDERQEYVYYFAEVEPNKIKANLISEIIDAIPEDDPTEKAPYRSTRLLLKEYEHFLGK